MFGRVEALAEHLVHGHQEQHLEHRRQAARRRVDAPVLVELHLLFGDLGAVALVLDLDRLELRLEHLHPALGHDLRPEHGHQQQPDDDRQRDDRDADVAEQVVEERQAHEQDLEHGRERPREEAEGVGPFGCAGHRLGCGVMPGVGAGVGVWPGARLWGAGGRGRGRRRRVGAGRPALADGAARRRRWERPTDAAGVPGAGAPWGPRAALVAGGADGAAVAAWAPVTRRGRGRGARRR